jgi:histidyl-tRNA synthetase
MIRKSNPELIVEFELLGRKLNKCLQSAGDRGVKYAVIVGANEFEGGNVVLKDLEKKTQKITAITDLQKALA